MSAALKASDHRLSRPHPLRQGLSIEAEFGTTDEHQLGEFAEVTIAFPLGFVLRVAPFIFGDDLIDAVSDR